MLFPFQAMPSHAQNAFGVDPFKRSSILHRIVNKSPIGASRRQRIPARLELERDAVSRMLGMAFVKPLVR
jgi:hypothetical protein